MDRPNTSPLLLPKRIAPPYGDIEVILPPTSITEDNWRRGGLYATPFQLYKNGATCEGHASFMITVKPGLLWRALFSAICFFRGSAPLSFFVLDITPMVHIGWRTSTGE